MSEEKEQDFSLEGNGLAIEKDAWDECEDCCGAHFYTFYLWGKGVSLWFAREEMYKFMELMTGETTQALFRNEMKIIEEKEHRKITA